MTVPFSRLAPRFAYAGVSFVFLGPLLVAMAWAAFGPGNSYMCPPFAINLTEYLLSLAGALILVCSLVGYVLLAPANPKRAVIGVIATLFALFASTGMGTRSNPVTVIRNMHNLSNGSEGCPNTNSS
jgi:hypothetical protein